MRARSFDAVSATSARSLIARAMASTTAGSSAIERSACGEARIQRAESCRGRGAASARRASVCRISSKSTGWSSAPMRALFVSGRKSRALPTLISEF